MAPLPVENNAILGFRQWCFIRLEFCFVLWFIFSDRLFLKYYYIKIYIIYSFVEPVTIFCAFFSFFGESGKDFVTGVTGVSGPGISSSSISELSLLASSFRILERDLDLDREAGLRLSTLSAGLWMKFPLLDVLRPGVWFLWSALDDETLIGLHFKSTYRSCNTVYLSVQQCLYVFNDSHARLMTNPIYFKRVILCEWYNNNWTYFKVKSMLGFILNGTCLYSYMYTKYIPALPKRTFEVFSECSSFLKINNPFRCYPYYWSRKYSYQGLQGYLNPL